MNELTRKLRGISRAEMNFRAGGYMARQLNAGDLFPEYEVKTVGGQMLRLPQDFAGEYAALIFYRGSW
jgi:hypothetical protein